MTGPPLAQGRRKMSRLKLALITGASAFFAGLIAMAALVSMMGNQPAAVPTASMDSPIAPQPVTDNRPTKSADPPSSADVPAATPPVAAVPKQPAADLVATPSISSDSLADLRKRTLDVPVESIAREKLHQSFDDARAKTRKHEGIDILAPRNTPVLAVEDGVVAKLFTSVAGGLTVYQFDPTRSYAYYYAHLERYAAGLKEGAPLKRRQVLGYVGTSGNAPKDTPHLHFQIFKLTEAKQWWKGAAIDPYLVLK